MDVELEKYIAVYLCFNYWLWRITDICGIWINEITNQILVGLSFFPCLWLFKYSVFQPNGGLKPSYFSLFQYKHVTQICWILVKQSWKHLWLLEKNLLWFQMVLGLGIMEYRVVLHLEMWCNNTGEYYNDGITHPLKRGRINYSCHRIILKHAENWVFCWSAAYLLWLILISLFTFFLVLPKMFFINCIIPVFVVYC